MQHVLLHIKYTPLCLTVNSKLCFASEVMYWSLSSIAWLHMHRNLHSPSPIACFLTWPQLRFDFLATQAVHSILKQTRLQASDFFSQRLRLGACLNSLPERSCDVSTDQTLSCVLGLEGHALKSLEFWGMFWSVNFVWACTLTCLVRTFYFAHGCL